MTDEFSQRGHLAQTELEEDAKQALMTIASGLEGCEWDDKDGDGKLKRLKRQNLQRFYSQVDVICRSCKVAIHSTATNHLINKLCRSLAVLAMPSSATRNPDPFLVANML